MIAFIVWVLSAGCCLALWVRERILHARTEQRLTDSCSDYEILRKQFNTHTRTWNRETQAKAVEEALAQAIPPLDVSKTRTRKPRKKKDAPS